MSGTQIHKVLTHAQGGQRLGTSSATWNKIKQAAADTRNKHPGPGEPVLETKPASCLESAPPVLVENGPNGEVCIWYEAQHTYEIWNWRAAGPYALHREDGPVHTHDFYDAATTGAEPYSGDTLALVSRFEAPGRAVAAMAFVAAENGSIFVSAYAHAGHFYVEARADSRVQEFLLPAYLLGSDILLKGSLRFVVVSSSSGFLYVLRCIETPDALLEEANCDGSLQAVYSHSTRTLVEKYGIEDTSSSTILLKTATFDGSAIYDIVGTWLVYCPMRMETEYYKSLMRSTDESCLKPKGPRTGAGNAYTSVKLPPKGPLFFRAASSLANSAIDRLFKLSQIGTKKVKTYWSPEHSFFDKDVSLHTISTSVSNALYSTASKIKKQADMIGENETVKIIDLSNGQIMATFKPPGGISHLSLSSYDLLLAQATYRGDSFYLWDLYKLPNEVSFVGKFVRGKTSAVIKEIFWFVNNKALDGLPVTNSGFGCISKKTGSVHWYNINYLFCANENDNFPNTMELLPQTIPKNGQFLDSWILPSINAVKLLKLPGFSNMPNNMSHDGLAPSLSLDLHRCNQLAFIDSALNLRLVSPMNGKHTFKYKLNQKPAASIAYSDGPSYSTWNPFAYSDTGSCHTQQNFDAPLSQTEIETCNPFPGITKDRNVTISSYAFNSNKRDSFWDYFSTFGNEVPQSVHEFTGSGKYETPNLSSEDLEEHLKEGLIIIPEATDD
ncbi:hypothetical protein METBIDRAFT_9816 [Metschnikowia bicuspidata var. bicuspidata NRRL YB-4993]|uniref:Uncharacterized protein n=1 Tax=Metschnikowia bicuspidata var. bicuspidata NRRL YB-4993 TaxID=869754 RepID=A0A1A0HHA6_9ASCO|nr:hypothetical protein METBIDRAFT_9816 [Metschnikowia bicuspidata var. bicuspidata NRRL YB-4993]OBA23564.1 hypothetical protein METBIDRAFT_9816 [Metschnikowia bicuspidata var. bicuspidata NRRL YB-4993]